MKREEIDELATSCGAETRTVPGVGVHIIYNDNRITNFVGRLANAIEARTIERCAKLVAEISLRDLPEQQTESGVMQIVCGVVFEKAIRALKDE